jgi:hypothetical protein
METRLSAPVSCNFGSVERNLREDEVGRLRTWSSAPGGRIIVDNNDEENFEI